MNAWTIYWILQLDSIGTELLFLCAITATVAICVAGVAIDDATSNPNDWSTPEFKDKALEKLGRAPKMRRIAYKWATAAFLLSGLVALTPSTKTAAAMAVLPAIANNERIQHEAGDLYQLAKQALTNAVAPDKPEPKK